MIATPTAAEAITAAWIDAVLGGRYGGAVRDIVVQRIGVGFGLAGETYRLDVALDGSASVALVVKLCNAASARHEGRVYAEILPRTAVRVPRFVAALDDGKDGAVVVELVEGARQGDCLSGCTIDEARAIARTIAALHAPWWAWTEASYPPWLQGAANAFTSARPLAGEAVERCVERFADALDDDARALVRGLPDGTGATRSALAAHPATINHRDLHLDNVLFDPRRGPVVLDWPNAGRAAAAVDVSRVLVECLRADDLPEGREAVCDAYLSELGRLGAGPYAHGDLRDGVRLAVRLTLAGAVGWAGAPKAPEPGSRVEALQRNLLVNCLAALRH